MPSSIYSHLASKKPVLSLSGFEPSIFHSISSLFYSHRSATLDQFLRGWPAQNPAFRRVLSRIVLSHTGKNLRTIKVSFDSCFLLILSIIYRSYAFFHGLSNAYVVLYELWVVKLTLVILIFNVLNCRKS